LNLSEDVNRYGFEFEIRGGLPLNLNYNFNASYVTGDRMELIPRWRSNLLFGIPFKEGFNLIYYLKYIGERKRASDDDRDDIDPVLLHNLTFKADLLKDRLTFRFDVRNLLDEEYESPDFSGRIEDDYPMLGRSIFGSIRLQTSWGSR
jgi:outer membrane receptor protein involved in Fe transport